VWLFLDLFATKKPNAVSMINGMIVGLVAITPGAGYVDGVGAIGIGLICGVIAWLSLNKLGNMSFMKRVDDTFGVIHTHAVAGLFGGLMVGVFGNPKMVEYYTTDPKGSDVSASGLVYGGGFTQLAHQAIAAACIIVFNVVGTFIILKVVSFIVPLRASEGDVEGGDLAIHGMDPIPIVLPANGVRSPAETRT
jgi:Amt family ammonium transporter